MERNTEDNESKDEVWEKKLEMLKLDIEQYPPQEVYDLYRERSDGDSAYKKACNWCNKESQEIDKELGILYLLETWNATAQKFSPSSFLLALRKNVRHEKNVFVMFKDLKKAKFKDEKIIECYKEQIKKIFDCLSLKTPPDEIKYLAEKPACAYVAAAKTMHLILPELFIPWDNNIREFIGVKKDEYVKFMERLKEVYSDNRNEFDKALEKINERLKKENYKISITKLLDGYLYQNVTRRIQRLGSGDEKVVKKDVKNLIMDGKWKEADKKLSILEKNRLDTIYKEKIETKDIQSDQKQRVDRLYDKAKKALEELNFSKFDGILEELTKK